MANRNPKLMTGPDTAAAETGPSLRGPDTAAAETGPSLRGPDTASAETGPSPRRHLLLHACCGPCSTHCVHTVREQGYEPVLFFSNSNIDTEEEFERRLAALRDFARAVGVEVLVDPYDPGSWRRATAGLEAEPEGGARCDRCFLHNLSRAAAKAAELGFDAFTTTLTVSPHKNSPRVFAAGRKAASGLSSPSATNAAPAKGSASPQRGAPHFVEIDFKKKDGFLDSVRLAKAYGLYRQNYCGCVFSKAAASRR